jgi:hypothetical protein
MRHHGHLSSIPPRRAGKIACLIATFALLVLSGYVFDWLSGSRLASAASPPVQLVRLSINNDAGMLRVEITADRPFAETTIEQTTRGRETVVHIRGAHSLLQSSYAVDDVLARKVRTASGVRDGEPFVDLFITLGEGATVAQKKIFNRLLIGIAADFAHLRRRTPAPGKTEEARAAQPAGPNVAHAATGVANAVSRGSLVKGSADERQAGRRETSVESNNTTSTLNSPASTFGVQSAALNVAGNFEPSFIAARPPAIFRGRNIWTNLPELAQPLSHLEMANLPLLFFQTQNSALSSSLLTAANFMPLTSEPPGASRGSWVPGTTTSAADTIGGRPFGPGILRPSFVFGAGYDDNFFYRSKDGRGIGLFTFAPRLEYEVPGEHRALRVAYEAELRRLTNGEWANGQKLDFDTRVEVSPFLSVSLRDHFVRSPLDPREYDPAGEVYIVGDTFSRNDAALRFDYQFDERNRFASGMGYNIVRWSDDHIAGAPLFINYREPQFDLSFERDMSERTTVLAAFTFGATYAGAPLRAEFNGLNNRRRYAFELGARTRVSQTSGLALRVGFERDIFYNAPHENDFSGLIFNLAYRRDLTEKTNFELTALRKTQVSAFNLEGGNARLLSTGGAARLEHTLGEAMKVALSLNYQRLSFPVAIVPDSTASGGVAVGDFAGTRRRDNLYGFSFETGYRVSEYLRSRFVYNFSRRDANIPVLTFNSHRLSLVFELGRRNDVRGRSF